MRMSALFSQTLREAPAEAEVVSHQLLLRAGFIRQLATGIFSYLPLARRSMTKIENILRDEMNAIGGQEITMPVVHPAELWKESGRWYAIGSEMGRFKDKSDRDMALAMTHEEVVADIVRKEVRSYRQLPALIYHIQTKWRDDPRPRAGLIRAREFTMKDSYSLDADWDGLDKQYRAHYQAYFNIFNRCGLPSTAVGADVGMMGGSMAHEYMYLTPIGEDTLLLCDHCGYTANRQIARFKKSPPPAEDPQRRKKVATPDTTTIKSLAEFLNITESKTAKAVFMVATMKRAEAEMPGAIVSYLQAKHGLLVGEPTANMVYRAIGSIPASAQQKTMMVAGERLRSGASVKVEITSAEIRQVREAIPDEYVEQFVLAIIRGDMEVNETKLLNAVKAKEMRPATEAEIQAVGAVPGYGSPIGTHDALVVVDDMIRESHNLVAGANQEGFHFLNVNLGRDYQARIITDIAAAGEGDACPNCGSPMRTSRGVEIGNIFKLGARYSDSFGCTYQDKEGNVKPIIMGSYGIGVGRLLACVAEEHHDEHGLIWPITVAPYQVHLVALGQGGDSATVAEQVYKQLQTAGVEVLFDDREATPGVKFADADLIGIPLRLTVSERSLKNGGVELKRRDSKETLIVPTTVILAHVQAEIAALEREIAAKVVDVPFVE